MSVDRIVPTEEDLAEQEKLKAAQEPEVEETEENPVEEPELPEKYRGKTLNEIVEMHLNAERELGRARNEIGTVRKLADELLGIEKAKTKPEKRERPKLTTDALFDDPDKAISDVIRSEAEEREAAIAERLAKTEAQLRLNAFEKKFPDYQETMQDQAFQQWIASSPYRVRLATATIQNDFDAAEELFGLYKEISQAAAPEPKPTTKTGAQRAARDTLTRPGGSTAAGVGSTGAGKKIWSRAELIEMRIKNPEKFDSLYESEILPAYREKRVR